MRNKTITYTALAALLGALITAPLAPAGGAFAPPDVFAETTCFLEAYTADGVTCVTVNVGGVPGGVACGQDDTEIPCALVPDEQVCLAFVSDEDQHTCGGGNVWLGKYWEHRNFKGDSIRFYGETGPCLPGYGYWVQDLSDHGWNNIISSARTDDNCDATLYSLDSCRASTHVTINRGDELTELPGFNDLASSICWHD